MEKGTVMRLCPFAWALPPMPLSPVSHSRGMRCRPLARDVDGGGVAWLCVWAANLGRGGIAREPSLPKTLKINGHLRWLFGLFFLILHVGTYKE